MQAKTTESSLPVLDAIDTTIQSYTAPPRTSFREPDPAEETERKQQPAQQKPAKKVRVLTPPPLSPDSPEWPTSEPMYQMGHGLVPPPLGYDPFGGSATDESDRDSAVTPPYPKPAGSSGYSAALLTTTPPATVAGGPPGNPFNRTLQDMEDSPGKEELDLQKREEGEALKAANASIPALNVDAFKRLLLTGKSGLRGDNQSQGNDVEALAEYNAEANKMTAAISSIHDHQQAGRGHNESQQGHHVVSPSTSAKDKKTAPPPPPPSSRHGKSIKNDQQSKAATAEPEAEHQHHASPEQYKPALNTQIQSNGASDEDFESASDEYDSLVDEATGPETPAAAAAASVHIGGKKPAPAPPPPRGHARTDTKTSILISGVTPSSFKPSDDDPPSRSSTDSMTAHRQDTTVPEKHRPSIPAPPPPRRPHAAPRQASNTGPSPSISSSSMPQRPILTDVAVSTSSASSGASGVKAGKSPAPPLPPARNPSFARRPPSIHSTDGTGLRKMDGAVPPPPPPPPRHRGNSPAQSSRKSSSDSRPEEVVPGGRSQSSSSQLVNSSKGADILADLDALRREVEALRGAAQ